MRIYSVGCKKDTKDSNSQLMKPKISGWLIESNCIICVHKNLDSLRLVLTEKVVDYIFGGKNTCS